MALSALLLLALEAGDQHLLGPLGGPQVVLQDPLEEPRELPVALRLGVPDERLERLGVVRGLAEHRDK